MISDMYFGTINDQNPNYMSRSIKILKILLSLLVLLIWFQVGVAQTEIGLQTSNLQRFHALYKRSTNGQHYFRLRAGWIHADFKDDRIGRSTNLNTFFAFGWEKRKKLLEKWDLYTGPEPRVSCSYGQSPDLSSLALSFGLGYIIGIQHELTPALFINAELIPSIRANWFWNQGALQSHSLNLTLDSTFLTLGASYRFWAIPRT